MWEGVYLYSEKAKRGHGFVTRDSGSVFPDAKSRSQKLKKLIRWYLKRVDKYEDLYIFAIEAANALVEPDRTAVLETINRICITKGLTRYSIMVALYLERSLTVEEGRMIIASNIERTSYQEAVAVANLILIEPERSETMREILSCSVSSGCLVVSKDIAQAMGRKLSKEELENILSAAIETGAFFRAMEIAKEIGRYLTRNEAEKTLKVLIKEGNVEESEEVLSYIGRSPRDGETQVLIEAVTKKNFHWFVIPLADTLSEPRRTLTLERLLSEFIEKGALWKAREAAGAISRPLSRNELERIVLILLSKGDLESALSAVNEMPVPERSKRMHEIIDISLQNEDFKITHLAAKTILKM